MDKKEKQYEVEAGGKTVSLTEQELLLCAKCVLEKRSQEEDDAITEFAAKYPAVREFPDEVAVRIANGEKPLDAYREYEIETLKAKLSALENNEINRKKSTGSVAGDASEPEQTELDAIYNAVFGR